jgi:hypothetical protein
MITFKDIEENSALFLAYMEEIDLRLRQAKVPIQARPLNAFSEIAKDGMQMVIGGALPTPHADQIKKWFQLRYGDRLLVDFDIGKAVILIWGDPYVMRLPLIYGKWNGIVDVTRTYVGMTKELFASLPKHDQTEMVNAFVWFYERYEKINNLPEKVTVNIDTAIQQMISQRPHYGESQWASLQTAEKTLKAFINHRNVRPPKIHILSTLLDKAEQLGLPGGFWPVLKMIQCDPSVRYEDGVTLDQAVLAHHASIDLCSFVAEHFQKKPTERVTTTDKLDDVVISFGHAVDSNHNGGLLFRFVMANGTERVLLFCSEICRILRDALRASLASGRHADERIELSAKRDFRNIPPRHPVRMFLVNQPEMSNKDFESTVNQVQEYNVVDFDNAVQFDITSVGGSVIRLIMDSVVVNYFVDYLDGGIEAGQEHGLFK